MRFPKWGTNWLYGVLVLLMTALLSHVLWDVPMRFFYQYQAWQQPSQLGAKRMYDYAHQLELPAEVPTPQPFNFVMARFKALLPNQPDVATQYFQFLCDSESGEYIFKTVDQVDGVFQMRPRGQVQDTPADFDRYWLEEPTGVGWSADEGNDEEVLGVYLQPVYGLYQFMERPDSHSKRVVHVKLNDAPAPMADTELGKGLPWVLSYQKRDLRQARYAYTWRGIQREQARRYGIAAGEYLIVDLDTHQVLAVKRRFKLGIHNQHVDRDIWWSNARPCDNELEDERVSAFVSKVLKPVNAAAEEAVPDDMQYFYLPPQKTKGQ